jgi:hypothetical protein
LLEKEGSNFQWQQVWYQMENIIINENQFNDWLETFQDNFTFNIPVEEMDFYFILYNKDWSNYFYDIDELKFEYAFFVIEAEDIHCCDKCYNSIKLKFKFETITSRCGYALVSPQELNLYISDKDYWCGLCQRQNLFELYENHESDDDSE